MVLVLCGLACACQYRSVQSYYGQSSRNDMQFGELDLVLVDNDGTSRLQMIPFFVFGEGTLPEAYGPARERFQRTSVGDKVRYPIPIKEGRIVVYFEGGAMVSYYDASAIGTPLELEVMGGIGAQIELGKGWALDVGARIRHPTGNGNDHDEPDHAPHGSHPEFIFGLKKDF